MSVFIALSIIIDFLKVFQDNNKMESVFAMDYKEREGGVTLKNNSTVRVIRLPSGIKKINTLYFEMKVW